MALPITSVFTFTLLASLLSLFSVSTSFNGNGTVDFAEHKGKRPKQAIPASDVDLLEFPLNLEYFEAEFFLWGSLGSGLDKFDPKLAQGGPPPVGVTKAFLDPYTQDVIHQFGLQEVGHLRAIKESVKGFPRPLLNLSSPAFARVIDAAIGHPLKPPFNPYANSLNFLIASYLIPYVGLTGYVGANPNLQSPQAKKLVAGLLAVESGQDAIIRGLLYQRRFQRVQPYAITVEEFTNRISDLRNGLGSEGVKDIGLSVLGQSKGKVVKIGNVLSGDDHSLGFSRTPEEILRIVYGSGNEKVVGGFFPLGGNGKIAKSYVS